MADNRILVAIDLLTEIGGNKFYAAGNQMLPAMHIRERKNQKIDTEVRIYSVAAWHDCIWTTDGQCIHSSINPGAIAGYGAGVDIVHLRGNPVVGWRTPFGFFGKSSKNLQLNLSDAAKVFRSSQPLMPIQAIPGLYVLDDKIGSPAYVHGEGVRKVRRLRIPFGIHSAGWYAKNIVDNKPRADQMSTYLSVLLQSYMLDNKIDTIYIGRIDPTVPVKDKLMSPDEYNSAPNRYSTEVNCSEYEEGMKIIDANAIREYRMAIQNDSFDAPSVVI